MAKVDTRRLNITLPEHFDALLAELAELSGRSKASFVLDAVKYSAPYFSKDLVNLRRAKSFSAQQTVADSPDRPPLTRQQRRALERQQAKKGENG